MSDTSVTKKMSAAAFFNDNRAIAGFGNSMRAVFTSIRELVENGLDSAEKRGVNPIIDVELRRLSSREINELLDVKQYKKLEKHLDFLQLTCKDNGIGVPGHQIAELFGRVLTGTKYGVIQTRGRFGLGAKMCLLYSMSSVDLPAKIKSRYFMDDITNEMHLMINLEKNEPIIMEHREYLPSDPNYLEEPGIEISITFTGAWSLAKNSVREYFRQLAIITPYATFNLKIPGDKEGEVDEFHYESVVDDMPEPPEYVQIHPWGCDITQFKAELAANKNKKIKGFLAEHFMGVTEEIAEDFFQLLEIDPNKNPKDLTSKEIRRIVHEGFVKAYQEAKDVKRKRDRVFQFDGPKGTSLSPLGAGRLRKGLEKELDPKFVEAISRPAKAYSGHPFIIEAAIGYGGGVSEAAQTRSATVQDNKIIYRYANRIPLIFGAGNDVITQVVSSIRWNEYGLTRQSDPLAVAVSLVSTKIPFPETSKEYISNVPEIEEEIRLALMQLGRRLKTFLSRAKRKRREHARLSRFVKSAPVIVDNLTQILEDENLPLTDFRFEKNRIASALAHGKSTKAKLFMPLGQRLFGLDIWCPSPIQNALKTKNIVSVSDFLLTPSSDLITILDLPSEEVYNIKSRTIFELDREGLSPDLDARIFVTRAIERRFDTEEKKSPLSLKDALNRRWIQNSYHFLATEYNKLGSVANFVEKLFESKKDNLINQLLLKNRKSDGSQKSAASLEEIQNLTSITQLKLKHLFPSFSELKEKSEGFLSSDLSVEEFLFQIIHPSEMVYNQAITLTFVQHLIDVFTILSDKFPNFKTTNITKMKLDWTDGYTKNAFHRRKIKTIEEFITRSIDDLILIKEMERILYSHFIDILVKNSPSIKLSDFKIFPIEEMKTQEKELITTLSAKGITTLAKFISFPADQIHASKLKPLISLLLEESKRKLKQSLIEKEFEHSISHLKIIPVSLERELYKSQIFTSSAFLAYPSPALRKMGLKKRDVERMKKALGTPIPDWIKEQELLKKLGILVLEELFFNSPDVYSMTAEEKKKYLEMITFLRSPIIFTFPNFREMSHLLREVGLNCIGRFAIWPNDELSEIMDLTENKIKTLKASVSFEDYQKNKEIYGKHISQLKGLFPKLIEYFGTTNPTVQDLFYLYPSEKLHFTKGYWVKIENISQLSQMEIIELSHLFDKKQKQLPDLKEALLKLKARNIVTIKQFLDLIPEIIESELSVAAQRNATLELHEMLKTRDIKGEDEFSKQILLICEFDEFQSTFALPISRVSKLSLSDFESLRNKGIVAVHQLFEYTPKELASILDKEENEIEDLQSDFKLEQQGTSFFEKIDRSRFKSSVSFDFEDSERFSTHEIESMILAGYDTVDKIFYLAQPMIFSASLVSWNVVDKFRKLLRSPLTLATWERKVKKTVKVEEEEGKEQTKTIEEEQLISLTTEQLNTLQNHGITRIIDLLVSQAENLSKFLGVSIEEAKDFQKNIRISDTGTDISELDIFKPEIVKALEEINIFTLEDLYFSTTKNKWNDAILPWRTVEAFKQVLNLPLNHISDMLDSDLIQTLTDVNVLTLLGFMLTSPESLMERTGIPDERIENIKRGLDLADILSYFSLPGYFLPELTFEQTEILRENKILTIADFILTSNQKLTKLVETPSKQLDEIKDSLTAQKIVGFYEEKGIFASETKLFDKSEQRQLSRDSIFQFERFQTIQELFYESDPAFYQLNPELWPKISAVQKVLALPLRIFTEISEYSIEVWEQNNIKNVFQLLFIPDEEITDPLLYRSISSNSSKMLEMRSFHYFSKLPSSVYNSSFFKEIVQDFEDKKLSDVITDPKVISHLLSKDKHYQAENYNLTLIRSLLELPLRITPFFNRIKKIQREDYKNTKIGDVFDIDLTEHPGLAPFYTKLMEVDSFNSLVKDVAVPISSIGLPRGLALKLSKSSVNTLIDFFSVPINVLSEITGLSMRYIKEIQNSLNYQIIVSFQKEQSHKILECSIITQKQIDSLAERGITDIETLYYSADTRRISDILPVENYQKIMEILSGSIRFIGFLSFDEIKRLEFYEINSVIDLALLDKKELFHITQNPIYKEFHALDILSLDELADKRIETAIPITLLPSIEEDYLEKINKLGIYSIQDFNSRMTEIRESHPHLVKLDVFREVQMYLASVAFIGLTNQQVQKLIYSGVGDILSFITEDVSTIALILNISEKEVRKHIEKIEPTSLAKEINRKGVKIDEFPVLRKSTVNYLLKSEKEYVQDIYSHYYQAFTISNVSDDVVKDFLGSCNISIYRITELSTETKLKLSQMGVLRIIDFLCVNDNELKNTFDGSIPNEISEIRKGQFTLDRGTPLLLNEPIKDLLRDLYFDPDKKTVEDLFGFVPEHLLQFSEFERIEKISNISFVEQLVSFLSLSIFSLPYFDMDTKVALRRNGVYHVIELISSKVQSMENVTTEITRNIRDFQRDFNLTKRMSETFSPHLNQTIKLPNKMSEKFGSYGLTTGLFLFDFVQHPLFAFSENEKKIIKDITNNFFRPVSWIYDIISLDVKNFNRLRDRKTINILSAHLLITESKLKPEIVAFPDNIISKFNKALNEEIVGLKPPTWAIKLDEIKLISDNKLLKKLKSNNITYLDELISADSIINFDTKISKEIRPILYSLKNFNINTLEGITSTQVQKLKQSGVRTVFHYLSIPLPLLSNITGQSTDDIKLTIAQIDLNDLEKSAKLVGLDIDLFTEISDKVKNLLKEYGCVSLTQAANLNLDQLPISHEDKRSLTQLVSMLLTPITIIGKVLQLSKKDVDELLSNNVMTYTDLLEVPQQKWSASIKRLLSRQKTDPNYLIKRLSDIKKFGVSIDKLGLTKSVTSSLLSAGISTIDHLLYLPSNHITSLTKLTEDDLEELLIKLNSSPSLIPGLSKELLIYIYSKPHYTIADILINFHNISKENLQPILESVSKIKNIEELKFKDPLSTTEKYIVGKGFHSYTSLITSENFITDKKLYERVAPYLLANIRFLDLDTKTEAALKRANITTIADLLILSPKTIAAQAKTSIKTITDILLSINIDNINSKVVVNQDSHLRDAFFLTDRDKEFLKSIGIFNLNDLREYSVYPWIVSESRIDKIRERIGSILQTPILYYKDILSLPFHTIEKKYLKESIFSVQELITISTQKEADKITEFLRTFSASTDKIKEDFITIDQVFSENELTTLKNDLKFKKITLFNELLLEMYVSFKKLSSSSIKILQTLKHPLSASTKFNTNEVQSLNSKDLYTYVDLLIKPKSYWLTFSPIKLKTRIQEILPSLTTSKIRSDIAKRIKISSLKTLKPNVNKELSQVYTTVDEIIYDIMTEDYRTSKSNINAIQRFFSTSTLLIKYPKISLKGWKKIKNNLEEVGDLFKLSNKDLGNTFSLPSDEALKILVSLTSESILKAPNLKANKILSSQDMDDLKDLGFRNYIQILETMKVKNSIPKNLKDKITILEKLDVRKLEPKLKESVTLLELIFLMPSLDNLTLTKSQKDLLNRTAEFMFSRGTELCTVLDMDTSNKNITCPDLSLEYLLLLHDFDNKLYTTILSNLPEEIDKQIKDLFDYLTRSPIILSEPTLENIDSIASQEFETISEMLLEPKQSLSNVVTDKTLERNLKNISLSLLKQLKKGLIDFPTKLFTAGEINTLKKNSIYSVEEALLFNKKTKEKNTKEWELCLRLKNIMYLELNDLPEIAEDSEILNYVNKNNLVTIYDLLAHCKHKVQSEKICKDIVPSIKFATLSEIVSQEQKRFSNFIKGADLSELLKKHELKTFGSLFTYLENADLQNIEPDFEKLLSTLRAPIMLLTQDATLVSKLNKAGYYQIFDLMISANINSIFSKCKLTDKQLTSAKEVTKKLNYLTINDIITASCYPITSVSFIDENIKKLLVRAGYSTISHLNVPDELLLRTSGLTAQPLSRITKVLNMPIYYLSDLTRENPSSLSILQSKNIQTINDIYISDCNQLSSTIKIPERQFKSILSTLTDQSIKLAQKDETKLKTSMPFIEAQEIQKLKEIGVSSIQELIFPTKEAKNSSAMTLVNVEKLLKHLDNKIEELDVKAPILVQIKQLGINNLREFILYPSTVLDSKVDLSYMAIKGLKNRLPLSSSKSVSSKKTTSSSTKASSTKKVSSSTKETTTVTKKQPPAPKKTAKTSSKPKTKSSTEVSEKKSAVKTTNKKSKQTTLLDVGSSSKKTSSSSSKSSSKNKKRSSGK